MTQASLANVSSDLTSQFFSAKYSVPFMEHIKRAELLSTEQLEAALKGLKIRIETHKLSSDHQGKTLPGLLGTLISSAITAFIFLFGGMSTGLFQTLSTMWSQDENVAAKLESAKQLQGQIGTTARTISKIQFELWMRVSAYLLGMLLIFYIAQVVYSQINHRSIIKEAKNLMLQIAAIEWVISQRNQPTNTQP